MENHYIGNETKVSGKCCRDFRKNNIEYRNLKNKRYLKDNLGEVLTWLSGFLVKHCTNIT